MSDPDYIVDLSGRQPAEGRDSSRPDASKSARPFLSVHFDCCKVYARIYRNQAGDAYVGWCPRCARKVTARIGPDGTPARVFRAG